jgi:hypothetical protein
VAVQVAFVLATTRGPARRSAAVSSVLLGIALVPLAATIARQAGGAVAWVPAPTPSGVIWAWGRLLGQGGPGPLGGIDGLVVPVVSILALAGFVAAWHRGPLDRSTAILLGAWVAVPFLGALAVSLVKPLFIARYVIVIVPAVAILAAAGVLAIPWRPGRIAAAVGVVALSLSASLGFYGTLPRPDWPAVTAALLEEGAPADRSVFIGDWGRVVRYYARSVGDGAETRLPLRLWRDLDPGSAGFSDALGRTAAVLAEEGRTIWVVVAGEPDTAPRPAVDPRFEGLRRAYDHVGEQRFRLVTLARFEPRGMPAP